MFRQSFISIQKILLLAVFVFPFLISCLSDDPIVGGTINKRPSPFNVEVTAISNSSVTVTWSESVDPEGTPVTYEVYVNLSNTAVATNLTTNSYTVTGLTTNSKVKISVLALDADGVSNYASTSFVDLIPNGQPTDFNVFLVEAKNDGATISWTASTDPEGTAITYDLYYILNDERVNSSVLVVEGYNGTSYTLTGLLSNSNYIFDVIAKDGDGLSKTKRLPFSTGTVQNPVVTDFTVLLNSSTNNSATISWTAATDPNGEQITYFIFLNGAEVGSTTNTNFVINGLASGNDYRARVEARNVSGGVTSYGFVDFGTVSANPPTAVSALAAPEVYKKAIKVSWNAATDADGDGITYRVKLNGATIAGTKATSVWLSAVGLSDIIIPNTGYTITVNAVDDLGSQGPESSINVTTATEDTTFKKVTDFEPSSNSLRYTIDVLDNISVTRIVFPTGLEVTRGEDSNKFLDSGTIRLIMTLTSVSKTLLVNSANKTATLYYQLNGAGPELSILVDFTNIQNTTP